MYSMGAVNLVKRDLIKLESFQGSVLKQVCGIGNRSHHTRLVPGYPQEIHFKIP